jgi:hypothetical protein
MVKADILVSEDVDSEFGFSEDGLSKYETYRITDRSEIPDLIPVISIHGETISTAKAITTIAGQCKSGKSATLHPIIAAGISPDGEILDPLEGVTVSTNAHGWAVIHFDTEQSESKHFEKVKTIIRRSGHKTCPDYFLSYNIRRLPVNECSEFMMGVCSAAIEKFGGIHSIIVDGIADFILDPNDQAQSIAIVKLFDDASIQFSCPVITVIHTNPGTNKLRGHLGSALERKSESVLLVTEKGDVSTLEPYYVRNAGKSKIPLIQFTYDVTKGYHVFCGNKVKGKVKELDRLEAWAKEALPPPTALAHGALKKRLVQVSEMGVDSCRKYISNMTDMEIIIKGKDGLYRYSVK